MSIDNPISPSLADICNVAYAVGIIGGKWKISIIWELADGKPRRLSELRRKLTGISEGVLIIQLKDLEQNGLIQRRPFPQIPPRVEYTLTNEGMKLIDVIQSLEHWGDSHRKVAIKKYSV
jgi:DNA-binding HxlR family transcriptional regulator